MTILSITVARIPWKKWSSLIVNKRVQNAVLGCNLKNNRMISVRFQGKPFNITVIQVYTLTSNAEEAEVERFYGDLQDLLEHPKKIFFSLKRLYLRGALMITLDPPRYARIISLSLYLWCDHINEVPFSTSSNISPALGIRTWTSLGGNYSIHHAIQEKWHLHCLSLYLWFQDSFQVFFIHILHILC